MATDKSVNSEHTIDYYTFFTEAFHFYNEELFGNELPNRIIVAITRSANTSGHFAAQQWVNEKGEDLHEIAMNPSYFGYSNLLQILSVFVHEMCHFHIYMLKGKAGANGYHCKQWANKMRILGLEPISHDKDRKGGLGSKVSHSIVEGGLFLEVTKKFRNKLNYSDMSATKKLHIDIVKTGTPELGEEYKDDENNDDSKPYNVVSLDDLDAELLVFSNPNLESVLSSEEFLNGHSDMIEKEKKKKPKNKLKYSCECEKPNNLWGRPGLRVVCLDCSKPFTTEDDVKDDDQGSESI